jgi:GNAT superfamily N-acetyltransferase
MKTTYGSSDTGTTISLIGNLITGVEVHPNFRHRGYARLWLTVVCSDADIESETLYLTVDPQERDIDFQRLKNFYTSLGFRPISDDPDRRAMVRYPYANNTTARGA